MTSRLFERRRYSELRRRIVRRATRFVLRGARARSTPPEGLPHAEIRRVLVCRPNHRLGNLVLLTPIVVELQRAFPGAEIDIVLAGARGAELFRNFVHVKRVYTLAHRMARHPLSTVRIALQIRRAHYDLAIDPCETSQSGRLLAAIAGAKYVIRAPDRRSPETSEESAMEGCIPAHFACWPVYQLRRALACPPANLDGKYPTLDLRLSAQERETAYAKLEQAIGSEGRANSRPIIGIFAEATGAKGLGTEWWRHFLDELRKRHPGAVMVEIVPADGRPRLADEVPSFGSPSPREVAAVISNMTCFVCADSGVMHLASASGVRTIGLFSVTDPSKYGPYGHGSQAIDTNGKSPGEVAELASALMDTFDIERAGDPCHPFPVTRDASRTLEETSSRSFSGGPQRMIRP